MQIRRRHLIALLLGLAGPLIRLSPARATDAHWRALREGQAFVLLRHALAPGTGDPANFQLGDCSTQRNLSEAGRSQARAIGNLFRQNGVGKAAVHASQWCRCIDTATGLGLGPVGEQPLLNSFFGTPEDGKGQTEELRVWLQAELRQAERLPLVLVTHQVNMTALTGIVPASGELLFASMSSDGTVSVIGREDSPT